MDNKLSKLKEALEWLEKTPYGGEWDSALVGGENGKNYHAVTNADDVVVRAADDSRHTSWLCDYLEVVSPVNIRALLAELEGQLQSGFTPEALAQEERAENAEQRVAELEAKMATPVRLPDTRQSVSGDRYQWSDGVFNYKQDAIALLREQGFIIEGGE